MHCRPAVWVVVIQDQVVQSSRLIETRDRHFEEEEEEKEHPLTAYVALAWEAARPVPRQEEKEEKEEKEKEEEEEEEEEKEEKEEEEKEEKDEEEEEEEEEEEHLCFPNKTEVVGYEYVLVVDGLLLYY